MNLHALTHGSLCLIASLSLLVLGAPAHAEDDALAKINATGASILPISADAKTYRFTALNVAKDFSDASLAPLAPLADKIVSLDVARSKVTDAGLKSIGAMKNLTELHLENTAVTDAGLDALKGLGALEYINLYGTKVTDAGAAKLGSLSKLKAIYLWQTAVTKNGVAALKKALPAAHVNIGWSAEDDAKPVAVAAAPAPAAAPKADAKAEAKPAAAAAPAGAGKPVDAAAAAKAVVFKDVILPVLEAKCTKCHGAEKSKGKLRVHTFADLMKGGSDGATTVVAGKPDESLAIKRAQLPKDDDEHMPPSDEPQLTKEEVALLTWWIKEGANDSITVAAIKKTPDIEALLGSAIKMGKSGADTAKAPEKPKAKPLTDAEKKAVAAVAAKYQGMGASLMPLALDTEQQRLSVINAADKFGDKELAELAPIAGAVAWVDLGRSQVTDAGMATLAKLSNLERLHLENTKVTDAGIANLAGLKNLEYLNLYGTKVTDAGIAKLATATGLKKLFVWQTAVTQKGAKALEAKVPGLVVNVGLSEAEIAKLTAIPPPAPPKKEEPKKEEPKKEEPKKTDAKADAKKPAPVPAPKAEAPKADDKKAEARKAKGKKKADVAPKAEAKDAPPKPEAKKDDAKAPATTPPEKK